MARQIRVSEDVVISYSKDEFAKSLEDVLSQCIQKSIQASVPSAWLVSLTLLEDGTNAATRGGALK